MTEEIDLEICVGTATTAKKPPQPVDTGGDVATTKPLAIATRQLDTVGEMLHIKNKLSPTNTSDSEEGFLSTSPDSTNGETVKLLPQIATTTTATTKTTTRVASNATISNVNTEMSTNEITAKITTISTATTPKSICTCTDPSKCVSLKNILDSFKSALSEEQGWAIIFQYMQFYRNYTASIKRHIFTELEMPDSMENMNLHGDGTVHCSLNNKNEQKQQQKQQQQQQQKNIEATIKDEDENDRQKHNDLTSVQIKQHKQQHQEQEEQSEDERNGDDTVSLMIASHKKILRKVAIIVYTAMDYNLQADEQCQMSQELEELITFMTSDDNDDDCIDEGIDEGYKRWDDDNDDDKCNETKEFDYVLDTCKKHVKPTVPEDHYRAVVRALVTETIELKIFLQQVLTDGTDNLHMKAGAQTSKQELAKLGFNDWACFWVQVIDELRRGVRLKKNNYERAPIEYELTPYEILMEDIRSKKYQLRKVMVNGDIPRRVKKDAHALILEFIRSRPPLKKASERKLPPPIKRNPSPREQLMDSIRKGQTLKHITPPSPMRLKDRLLPPTTTTSATTVTTVAATATVRSILPKTTLGTSNDETLDALKLQENMEPQTTRSKLRLIKVDFSLLQDDDNIFDEPSNSTSCINSTNNATSIGICSQPKMPPYPIGGYMPCDSTETTAATRTSTGATISAAAAAAAAAAATKGPVIQIPTTRTLRRTTYDLAVQNDTRCAVTRRHTIVGCQSNNEESNSTPASRPDSRQSDVHAMSSTAGTATYVTDQSSDDGNDSDNQLASTSTSTSTSSGPWNKSFFDEKTWKERGEDHLSLSLDEIVHIRSVITKAQLEGLPVEVRVREDVEKRKICFLCLRTRFWFLGPRGIQCKLCQRTVCTKCSTKMRIPSEHFRNVPLVLISPSLLASPAGSNTPSPSHHARYMHSSSTGNIIDETFPKSLIERLLYSESEQKTRQTVGSAPASPKHQRSNMSTPGIAAGVAAVAATAAASGQAVEALHANVAMTSSYPAAAGYYARPENSLLANCRTQQLQQQLSNRNISNMSRSMDGPRSLPANSPARSIHSNCSTLDRKNKISRAFTLSASGSQLNQQEQKENMRGELVSVCNDCKGLVMEITRSSRHRSSARNRALKNMTLDLSPVYK